jgi:hypothetical protein
MFVNLYAIALTICFKRLAEQKSASLLKHIVILCLFQQLIMFGGVGHDAAFGHE